MAKFCTNCGKPLSPGSRFCEYCGVPVSKPAGLEKAAVEQVPPKNLVVEKAGEPAVEKVIGHVLAESRQKKNGFLGRFGSKNFDILFTPQRLLFIKETEEINNIAISEGDRVHNEVSKTGVSYRSYMDSYRWNGPPWQYYYSTPVEKLLSKNRENWFLDNSDIRSAVIRLDQREELDELELQLVSGDSLTYDLFMTGGGAAARFLQEVLGSSRVMVEA